MARKKQTLQVLGFQSTSRLLPQLGVVRVLARPSHVIASDRSKFSLHHNINRSSGGSPASIVHRRISHLKPAGQHPAKLLSRQYRTLLTLALQCRHRKELPGQSSPSGTISNLAALQNELNKLRRLVACMDPFCFVVDAQRLYRR